MSLYLLSFSKIFLWYIGIIRQIHINEQTSFITIIFLQLYLVYLPGLPCQYRCQNHINWWNFCFQLLLVVYVLTNWFHMADRSFSTNTSGCTDLVYHADLDITWVLARDSQTQCGQWVTSTNWIFTVERLIFHPSFSSFIFLVFTCVLIYFDFSVDENCLEMLSVLRLISFKYFFVSLVTEYIRYFPRVFYTLKHPMILVV